MPLENPIAYKHSLHAEEARASASCEEERRHVRGLPDVLPPIASSGASGDGGIIAKIAASRKERHEAAVEDMRQELAGISAVCLWLNGNTDGSSSNMCSERNLYSSRYSFLSPTRLLFLPRLRRWNLKYPRRAKTF